ncbi:hypothetical protein M4951_03165 [Blastopirellula sp. J2-11]|uniref:hypothetical protein n=1 Tax=Blastopirellula sp. J2-11 TaxID=2943192 RepID=UPI0021C577C3|nr:hypothetical protein [Blastopirellula sp. J2-11]UUO07316.1 hypothetical protein M4951_03165 [Blastopirellula sp. J2-11]
MNATWKLLTPTLVGCTLLLGATALTSGCDQKEKILDIEGPRGEVEVERDKETGDVDVEVNRDR